MAAVVAETLPQALDAAELVQVDYESLPIVVDAKAALRQAAALYQSTVIAAYQNVADTLHASISDADALAADVDAETSSKVTFDLTRRQLEAGYANYLALLSAETAYNQALLTRVQAQAVRYGDTIAMFQALGGGWWNRKEVAAR